MATSHGDDEPGCSRKRSRHQQRDVELIDLVDMELDQSQHSLCPSTGEPCPPAWAKKRTNLWVKDATEFLCLEPNNVGADKDIDTAQNSHLGTADEFSVNIPLQKMLHSYAEYREKCVICYHKSRILQDAEMEQWVCNDDALRVAVERVWPLGQGFFAIKFGAKSAAEKVLLDGEMPFSDGHVHVVPYIPCFFPSENAKQAWPVWVSFPSLPLFLKPFLKEIASGLGKVLHVSQPSNVINPVSSRVCILWDAQKKAPDNVKVSFDQLGAMKLAVAFDTIVFAVATAPEHEIGEENRGTVEPLALLPPADAANGEQRCEKEELALASNDKEPVPSSPKAASCVSPSPHGVKESEPAVANALKEIKGPIITSPVSILLGTGISKCPIANPIQVTHPLSIGACLLADGRAAQWASGREALTTYDNALYQRKKSKSAGRELAVLAPQHHAMKEVGSNSQVKHAADSKKNALKYVYSCPGKENNGTRKDPKFDKENVVSRKDCKDEEKSLNKTDHKLVSGHIGKNGFSYQSPEALTSSPKPYYLSPLPYGTPPTS